MSKKSRRPGRQNRKQRRAVAGPTESQLQGIANLAMKFERPVMLDELPTVDVVAVPDTIVMEGIANGMPSPDGLGKCCYEDGRSVTFFNVPKGLLKGGGLRTSELHPALAAAAFRPDEFNERIEPALAAAVRGNLIGVLTAYQALVLNDQDYRDMQAQNDNTLGALECVFDGQPCWVMPIADESWSGVLADIEGRTA